MQMSGSPPSWLRMAAASTMASSIDWLAPLYEDPYSLESLERLTLKKLSEPLGGVAGSHA